MTWRRNSNSSGPIVVHVCHLVGEALHVIGLHVGVVVGDYVMGWRHSALVDVLRDQEEVVVVSACYSVVDCCAWFRIDV